MEAYGEGAGGGDGREGGEPAAAVGGADQDVVECGGGRAAVPGTVVAGPCAGGEGGGEQGPAGGGPQLFLRGPGGRAAEAAWTVRCVAPPADLVAGQGEGDEDLSGGRGVAAGQRGERLGEQIVAVGEGAALRDQQTGAGTGSGRGPAPVASGGAATPLPAVPVQQDAEDGGVDVRGLRRPAVPGGFGGVRADRAQVFLGRAVRHGFPPVPTRAMMSHSARSSKMRAVGMRTVVRRSPVTGCPARLTQ